MIDPHARSQAKSAAQTGIDAATTELAAGAITEAERQRRVTDAFASAFLREDDPRWQSGFDGDAELWRQARSLVLVAARRGPALVDRLLRDVVASGGRLIVGPVYEADVPVTVAAFIAAGLPEPETAFATDRDGKVRVVIWAQRDETRAPAA